MNLHCKPLQIFNQSNLYILHLQISCYDYDNDGGHDLIGIFTTTLTEMFKADRNAVSIVLI